MATLDLTGDEHLLRLPTTFNVNDRIGAFAGRFDYRYQGLAVVCTETSPGTWAITTHPGIAETLAGGDGATTQNDSNSADYVFYGGNTYDVSDSNLVAALAAAGYSGAGLVAAFSAGFDGGFS